MPFPSVRRFLVATPFALVAVATVPAEAGPFSSLVVFGDSLSDDGNNFAAGLFNPAQVGFANATNACGVLANADCSKYVYWDGIHPTAAGHEAIAEAMFAFAVPVPAPETWVLLVAGLAAVAWTSRPRPQAPKRL